VIPAEVVLDASVVVRGLVRNEGQAREIMNQVARAAVVAHAPDLIVAEVTNALHTGIDARRWPVEAAQERLETFLASPIEIQPCGPLAVLALTEAALSRISAYDAFYAVLSAALEVPLVTADRKLAGLVPETMLVE
jgi:predicted nucleic acid-binding protein